MLQKAFKTTRVKSGKQYYKLFQISYHYQTILAFSESYWQTILQTFPEFISNNREFLANQTIVTTFFDSSYYTIFTLSESYYQTILTYSEVISKSTHSFTGYYQTVVNQCCIQAFFGHIVFLKLRIG